MKNTAKILTVISATVLATIPLSGTAAAIAEPTDNRTSAYSTSTVYSTDDKYNYRLQEAFTRSPDSFEAVINMPEHSVGGTIMGNYLNSLMGYSGCVDWEADALGRISVFWNNGTFKYTFKNVSLSDGQWHHIALIRDSDNNTFSFYVDGEHNETVNVKLRDAICNMPMNVGVDCRNWTTYKQPFDGAIEQITIYNGAISEERINQDMSGTIADDLDGALIGNWTFGKQWTEEKITESFGSGNDAVLASFEKYVPVRETGEYDYTLVGIPDIQSMVAHRPNDLNNAMNWLANNAEQQKIAFAMQVGDLSDYGSTESFYRTAAENMSILDGKVPYSFVQGNHDYDDNCTTSRDSALYNKYFPYAKYSKLDHFGGAYEKGSMSNTYNLFDVCGVEYLALNLEFGAPMSVIRWAGRVCEMYPERRVIVTTHGYLDPDGTVMTGKSRYSATAYAFSAHTEVTTGEQLYDGLIKRYPNIFMVLCGHNCVDDAVVRTDIGDNGNRIITMLIDPQCTRVNGAAWGEDPVMLMRFNESKRTIDCIYYSAKNNACFNVQNQFTLKW